MGSINAGNSIINYMHLRILNKKAPAEFELSGHEARVRADVPGDWCGEPGTCLMDLLLHRLAQTFHGCLVYRILGL